MKNNIDEIIKELSIEQKIGQMIFAGLNTTYVDDEFLNLIKEYPFGSVGLFDRNIDSIEQVKTLTSQIRDAIMPVCNGIIPLIATDQEGGVASQFPSDASQIPGNIAIGATRSEELAYDTGHITGLELSKMGININWSPVLDVNTNPLNNVINVRSFGDDMEVVTNLGAAMAKGLRAGGVGATGKHFPGHGDTEIDSHLGMPINTKGRQYLFENAIPPFKKIIDEGIDAIMVSHIAYPELENGKIIPATLSYEITTNILRNKLNFNGVIMTDDLQMHAITNEYTIKKAAYMSVAAGADMIIIGNSKPHQITVFNSLLNAVHKNKLSVSRIDESVRRILGLKLAVQQYAKTRVNLDIFETSQKIENICSKSIVLVRDPLNLIPVNKSIYQKVLVITPKLVSLSPTDISETLNCNLGEYLSAEFNKVKVLKVSLSLSDIQLAGIINESSNFDLVIIGTENANEFPNYLKLINKLSLLKPLITVSLRYPYEIRFFPENATVVAAFSVIDKSMEAVKNVIVGKAEPTGKLPITL